MSENSESYFWLSQNVRSLLSLIAWFPRARGTKKTTCSACNDRSTYQQPQIRAVWCVSAACAFNVSCHTCASSKSEANASNTKEEVRLDRRAEHAVTAAPLTLSLSPNITSPEASKSIKNQVSQIHGSNLPQACLTNTLWAICQRGRCV